MPGGVRIGWRRVRRALWAAAGATALLAAGLAVVVLWPMDPGRYLRVIASGEVLDRNGRTLQAFLNEEGQWCFERDLEEISPLLAQATIAVEDQRFRRHLGVDPLAVGRALWQNVTSGRTRSGASTLTMQVVKQAAQRASGGACPRSVWNKAGQAIAAIRLDARVSKDEILRVYLNTAPYGMNLAGCEAAARRYFGKPSRELTLAEAALLAGLPKAPGRLAPCKQEGAARARRNHVLDRMLAEGYISEQACAEAREAPLGAYWHEFPSSARHVAARLKPSLGACALRTTLDKSIQEMAQRSVRDALAMHGGAIGNAAAMVVDVERASILAYVGSTDFFDTPGGGQVDACRAVRSPGSALKPFTYAYAMQCDKLYASETLLDRTLDYGLYNPENIDGKYEGLVTATEALRHSLNVPAVTVLDRIGYGAMHKFLRNMGLTTLVRTPDHYGLGLTLGNCGARLDELTTAYCMLASLGELRPLRLVADAPVAPGARRLERGICLKLYEMLEQPLPKEDLRERVPAVAVGSRACWKTGTSAGHRDAWAFAFNAQYVVGVWMGNNDAKPSPRLVGRRAALPLAAAIFRSLPDTGRPAWPEAGEDLRVAEMCAVSGLPATPWCAHTEQVWLPCSQFLNRRCDVHYPLDGADDSGGTRVAERWPGKAQGWDLARVPVALAPAEQEEAGATRERAEARRDALHILVPSQAAEYVLTGEKQGDRIKLRSSVDEKGPVHWYLDDTYIGHSEPQAPLFIDLTPGKHRIACMAGAANMQDAVTFEVEHPGEASAALDANRS